MTSVLLMIIFLIILFDACYDYISSIDGLSLYSSMDLYRAYPMVPWVSGKHCVSVVLIPWIPANAPYILGHVVDRGCDRPIESFAVPSLNVGSLVECNYLDRLVMLLIYLSNVHHA
jgi:hypothetical protein